jgi:conjugal transfer mating pair stabilization protein TraN
MQSAVAVCPSGTTLSGSVCTAPPTCPTGTVLSAGRCQSAANLSCPIGYTLSGNQCVKPPDCVVGTFNATNDLCVTGTNPCPTGFTLIPASDVCTSSPICPTGGAYDPGSGVCLAQETVVCSLSGFLLDPVDTVCWQDADCGVASLDTARDICWIPATPDCGLLSWEESSQLCQGDPTCAQGTFNPQTQMCEWIPRDDCYEWTLNQGTHLCGAPPQCPAVANPSLTYTVEFDGETGLCLLDVQQGCLPGYVLVEPATCEKPMSCPEGEYDPVANVCPTSYICPLGSQYQCADMGSGTPQCSPYTCLDLSTDSTPDDSADTSTYVDDGEMTQTGECLGLWKIFSGKGTECLPPGLRTTFFNCCDDDESSFLILKEYCPEQSFEAVSARASGRTHYIGTYCKRRLPFVGCVQRAKMYCAFNSKIGRIIQEGCRPQLYDFAPTGAWGTAKHPNCVGISPEQFQSCDFGKIDFSEVADDFAPNLNLIVPSLQGAINAVP